MSLASPSPALDFALPAQRQANAPPEERGHGRDDVRLMVSFRASGRIEHRAFSELPAVLRAGDLLVVNRSATLNAALDGTLDGRPAVVHLSRRLGAGRWIVEIRHLAGDGMGTQPWLDAVAGTLIHLPGGGSGRLLEPAPPAGLPEAVRLWQADLQLPGAALQYLGTWGRPIVYGHIAVKRPLAAYQSIFACDPGSAEMPSAARPFTTDLVRHLIVAGVDLAPVLLHCGVSSLESHEPLQAEPFEIPPETAQRVNAVRRLGGRVIAVGTTVVRALESAAARPGLVLPARGVTDLVIGAGYSPRIVSGVLTGWHEPRTSHLAMLEAIAGADVLAAAYRQALDRAYLWHEFGDSHLILP